MSSFNVADPLSLIQNELHGQNFLAGNTPATGAVLATGSVLFNSLYQNQLPSFLTGPSISVEASYISLFNAATATALGPYQVYVSSVGPTGFQYISNSVSELPTGYISWIAVGAPPIPTSYTSNLGYLPQP